MAHWKTDVAAYLKLAVGAFFYGWMKYKGLELTPADYVVLAALGLGAAGNKVSADAPPKDPQA